MKDFEHEYIHIPMSRITYTVMSNQTDPISMYSNVIQKCAMLLFMDDTFYHAIMFPTFCCKFSIILAAELELVPFRLLPFHLLPFRLLITTQCHFAYSCITSLNTYAHHTLSKRMSFDVSCFHDCCATSHNSSLHTAALQRK